MTTQRCPDLMVGESLTITRHNDVLIIGGTVSEPAHSSPWFAVPRNPTPQDLFNAAQIPARFQDAVFRHGDPDRQSTSAMASAARWLRKRHFDKHQVREGFILSGPSGIGKSFALAATVRSLTLQFAIPAWFISLDRLLLKFKTCYQGNDQEKKLWDRLCQISVLALDDVAVGRPSDWAREILRTTIAFRYNACAPTLIATSHSFDRESSSSTRRNSFRDWVGEHCFSRLTEMCLFLPVSGSNLRQNPLSKKNINTSCKQQPVQTQFDS